MSNYWDSYWTKRTLSRRRVLAGGTITAAGVAGMALAGCGDDDDDDDGGSSTPGGGGTSLTPTAATPSAAQAVKGGTLRALTNVGSISTRTASTRRPNRSASGERLVTRSCALA